MRIAVGRLIAWAVAGLILSASFACARSDWIQSTLVTVEVSGEWQGNITRPAGAYGPGLIYLTFRQSGHKVTGTFSLGVNKDVPLEGTISVDVLRFQGRGGLVTAELQVNGDDMSGTGTSDQDRDSSTAVAGAVRLSTARSPLSIGDDRPG
jgi:hypothetical protein